jgi:dynein heavy chain
LPHVPCRKLFKLTKVFSAGAAGEARELPLAVAEEGRNKVSGFQAYTPLIAAVCNLGLRERHWAAMAEIVGFEIKQDEVRHGPVRKYLAKPCCQCA